jgi:hypothetical protein
MNKQLRRKSIRKSLKFLETAEVGLARELASFGKIKARRARVTFRNRKLASFGKMRARPGKPPDQFYLNPYF